VTNDSDIIRRSLSVSSAFSELYDRHATTIHRFVSRRAGSDVADDVMSETFLVAFERRRDYDLDRDTALPWLYGIASTLLRKHARTEARAWRGLKADHASHVAVDAFSDAEGRADARRAVDQLGHALHKMHARDRETLLLYAWADLDYEGIAQALDIPVGTVRSRLNRARRLLRASTQYETTPRLEDAPWTN